MKVTSMILVLMVGMTQIAHASAINFVHTDNYTTDLLSGLDWLDINATTGRSYNDVLTDITLISAGWHYASVKQLSQMVKDYTGISADLSAFNQMTSAAAGSFARVTGYNGENVYGDIVLVPGHGYMWADKLALLTSGITADIDPTAANTHKAVQFDSRPFDNVLRWSPFSGPDSTAQANIGSFLIRNSQNPAAVPLPSAIYVFMMTIFGWQVLRLQSSKSI